MTSRTETSAIFVYGTLKRGQIRARCWPRTPRAIQQGFCRGQLFDLGPYPAIVPGEDVIAGEIWHFTADDLEATLDTLDRIEGYRGPGSRNLYERVVVQVFDWPNLEDTSSCIAYTYQLRESILPPGALRIQATRFFEGCSQPFAAWPADDAPPELTSQRADPFPDDLPKTP